MLSEWLGRKGGAKAKLDNEKPQGETVNYDELVETLVSGSLTTQSKPRPNGIISRPQATPACSGDADPRRTAPSKTKSARAIPTWDSLQAWRLNFKTSQSVVSADMTHI